VRGFLERHWNEHDVRADVARLEAEHSAESPQLSPPQWDDDPAAVTAYVHWLMDQDRKSTGLKSLQGKIWEEGYQAGELRSEVYPDVPPALEQWRAQGIEVAIFSSGSVQAQQSVFRNTAAGDLTRYIRAYFDTTTGPKADPQSYARIAAALQHSSREVLFVSDVVAELDAALRSRMNTALCVREEGSIPLSGAHRVIRSFDQLFVLNSY
jgi:enolase-phosphatase E1